MAQYTLPHDLAGEKQRLALMSKLLDPMERAHLQRLGVRTGWRCLEIGCGNGSIAQWLAEQVAPSGSVVASDIDTKFLEALRAPCLEVQRIDVLHQDIETDAYDLVVARAVLHHLADAREAVRRMTAALKPGGVFLSVEPDMLPCTVAEPDALRAFWEEWLRWSREAGIDYFIGRKVPAWLAELEMKDVAGEGHTALFNGGSQWAKYWTMSVRELAPRLMESGHVTREMLEEFYSRYEDPRYWTSVITFTANWGKK